MINQNFSFCTPVFGIRCLPPTISVGMENIRPSQQARNLGMIFDDTMSLSPHVNTIVKGAFYHIRNISKVRKYTSKSTIEILLHSFVSSKLDVCNFLLFGAQKRDIVKLQSIHNAAARITLPEIVDISRP